MDELAALIIILSAIAYVVTRSLVAWSIRRPRSPQAEKKATPDIERSAHSEEKSLDQLGGPTGGEDEFGKGDA
jgi:hypothetical protein